MKTRVSEGGHNIEPEVIERRYERGIKNLFDIYLPIVDEALIFDNSDGATILIADKKPGENLQAIDDIKFTALKSFYEERYHS